MSSFRVISFLLLAWVSGFIWFISQIESSEPSIIQEADAIIVLTGSKGRIDAGLQLLIENKAKHLFVSGVGQKAALDDLSRYLISFDSKQVEPLKASISLGHFANSTEENALETAQWVAQNNYKKIILVTSNYHMPRSLFLIKKAMPTVTITPYQVVKNEQYWNNISTLKLIFLEYNKFLFSYAASYLPI